MHSDTHTHRAAWPVSFHVRRGMREIVPGDGHDVAHKLTRMHACMHRLPHTNTLPVSALAVSSLNSHDPFLSAKGRKGYAFLPRTKPVAYPNNRCSMASLQ